MQYEDYDTALQRYLDGDMSDQERTDFEDLLASDEQLREQLEEYKNLGTGIEQKIRGERWSTVQNLEKEAEGGNQDKVRTLGSYWPPLAVAAAIALLIASYFIFMGDSYSPQDLYAEYFKPYPAIAYAPDRNESEVKTLKEQAYAAYSNENYSKAISFFKQILSEEDDPLTRFYLGNAYLQEGNSREAVEALSQFLEYDTEFKTQASWYLGLAYLANDEIDRAKEIFINLSESNTSYAEKANVLVNNLNEITMSKSEKDQVNQEQNVSNPNKIIRPDPRYARVTDTRIKDHEFLPEPIHGYLETLDQQLILFVSDNDSIRVGDIIDLESSTMDSIQIQIPTPTVVISLRYYIINSVDTSQNARNVFKYLNQFERKGALERVGSKFRLTDEQLDISFPPGKVEKHKFLEDSLADGDTVYYKLYDRKNGNEGNNGKNQRAVILEKVSPSSD